MTHSQTEAGVAGGGDKVVERQREVYVERLAAGSQVHWNIKTHGALSHINIEL